MAFKSKYLLDDLPVVNPKQALLFKEELGITTTNELLRHYPMRYEDRSTFVKVKNALLLEEKSNVQMMGKILGFKQVSMGKQARLYSVFTDDTGSIELVWFKGISAIKRIYDTNTTYILYGKISKFSNKKNIVHPELEEFKSQRQASGKLIPIYPLTEKLRKNYVNSKKIGNVIKYILEKSLWHIPEDLPAYMLRDLSLSDISSSIKNIHKPPSPSSIESSRYRLKFSELLYNQLQIIRLGLSKKTDNQGYVFRKAGYVHKFYNEVLPFSLTNAQKKVIKEIYTDMKSGRQMNRLLQGDVGSGKTVVAFICMLIAISNGKQVTIMAPTEVLAQQHYEGLLPYAEKLDLTISLLTGSVKNKDKKVIHETLSIGQLNILVGTHALLEDKVQYQDLGLAIIDEQHRFGVAQRSKLWEKSTDIHPHILVMTATPIPRTLAMTVYGNLDVSIINELPANRIPIITKWHFEKDRLMVFGAVKRELQKNNQAYFVYPLIEESETLDLLDLDKGFENISRAFEEYHPLSIVHGRQKPDAKALEMRRFVDGETRIMVATTVIEVGVDVPNASIMIIENAERFGLSQLHQLRGRVGRGSTQSYCYLMTGNKLSSESKERLKTMVSTTDGFKIAQKDMELRGPGNLAGTQQSGLIQFTIADIIDDEDILILARKAAKYLLKEDPNFEQERHLNIKRYFQAMAGKSNIDWSKIS